MCTAVLYFASNASKNWQIDFLALEFFTLTKWMGYIGLLLLNPSGVETIPASRMALYYCWSSHFSEYLYNFWIFPDIYVHTFVVKSLSVYFAKFVSKANSVVRGLWVMIYCCRFWNDEILLEILEIERFKTNYIFWYVSDFFIQTILIKGQHIYYLNICDIFWDVKM